MSPRPPRVACHCASCIALLGFIAAETQGGPVASFDDDNDGFTAPAAGFALDHQSTGGNPAGFALLSDLDRGGPGGFVHAPESFLGDLTDFASVQWDLIRPTDAILPATVLVEGPGGRFVYAAASSAPGSWETITAPFDAPAAWVQADGSGTLAETLGGVTRLGFLLEVTPTTGTEAGLDNVKLLDRTDSPPDNGNGNNGGQIVPLPAALPATLVAVVPVAAVALVRRLRRRMRRR